MFTKFIALAFFITPFNEKFIFISDMRIKKKNSGQFILRRGIEEIEYNICIIRKVCSVISKRSQ